MAKKFTTAINENEYIGDSLVTINTNFSNLDINLSTLIASLTALDTTDLTTLKTSLEGLSSLIVS